MKLFRAEKYRGMRICVALSGGLDSVCMLHAFKECAKEYGITLSAAHLDHHLRPDSFADRLFCETLCKEWDIPFFSQMVPVGMIAGGSGRSVEEVGREVRYGFFRTIVEEGRADVVATAHHMNDVAETVLFRIARGTALAGMKGITEREGIIRPMLDVTRKELELYAGKYNLPHVEDSTNADERYSRNHIRHTVLPALVEINEEAVQHITRFASFAARDDEYLQSLASERVVRRSDERAVPVDLPEPLFLRACLQALKEIGFWKDYTYQNLGGLARLRNLQSGKKANLPCGYEAVREYGHIVLYKAELPFEEELPFDAKEGTMYKVGGVEFAISGVERANSLRADLDAFPEGCVVRTRREGDKITPYHGREKTLKKFLTDRKISARLGKKLPLIAKGNEILAVVGVEISDKVKVTETTKRVGFIV